MAVVVAFDGVSGAAARVADGLWIRGPAGRNQARRDVRVRFSGVFDLEVFVGVVVGRGALVCFFWGEVVGVGVGVGRGKGLVVYANTGLGGDVLNGVVAAVEIFPLVESELEAVDAVDVD